MKNISTYMLSILLVLFSIYITNAQVIKSSNFDTVGDLEGWTVNKTSGSDIDNDGWSVVSSGGSSYSPVTPFEGTGMLQFNSSVLGSTYQFECNSPALSFAGGTYQVKFQMYRTSSLSSSSDNIEVFYNSELGSAGGTSLGIVNRPINKVPVEENDGWYEYTFYIPGTPNSVGYISILGSSAYGKNIYIDNVIIEEAPSCVAPSIFVIQDITDNSANISCTAPVVSTPISYEFYCSTANEAPTDETEASGTFTAGTNGTINNLIPQTTYNVWLRSVCGSNDKSTWSSNEVFETACGTLSVSFENNFDTVPGYQQLPECWSSAIIGPSSNNGYVKSGYDYSNSSDIFIKMRNSSDNSGQYFLYTPVIGDLNTNKQIEIDIYRDLSYNATEENAGAVEVGILYENVFTALQTIPMSELIEDDWKTFEIQTTAYTGGQVGQIAFKYQTGTSTNNAIYLNNFVYKEIPNCYEPTALTVSNILDSTTTVSWTAPSAVPANGYEYYVSTNETVPSEDETPTGTADGDSVTLTGLDSNSLYYTWIRSVCSTDDRSEWSEMTSFKTECSSVSVGYENNFDVVSSNGELPDCWKGILEGTTSTSSSIKSDYDFSDTSNIYITIEPRSDVSGTYTVLSPYLSDFDNNKMFEIDINKNLGYNVSDEDAGQIQIGVEKDSEFIVLKNVALSMILENEWKTFKIYGNDYLGSGAVRFCIKHIPGTSTMNEFKFNNFKYKETPSCAEPTNLMVSDITGDSAQISWTAPFTTVGDGYEYFVSTSDAVPATDIAATGTAAATSAVIIDLEGTTVYYIWVRSICSTDDKSDWSDVQTFKTLCADGSDGYETSFDGNAVGTEIACWTTRIIDKKEGTYPYIKYTEEQKLTGDGAVKMYNSTDDSGKYYLISPVFIDLSVNKELTVNILRKKSYFAEENPFFKFEVGIMTDLNDINSFQLLSDVTSSIVLDEWKEVLVGFTNYTGPSTGHIVFKWTANAANAKLATENSIQADSDNNYMYITDISYGESAALSNIEVLKGDQFKVYPNPFTDIIQIDNIEDVHAIEVYDISGRLVKSLAVAKTLNLSSLDGGMYFLTVTRNEVNETVKIIKK